MNMGLLVLLLVGIILMTANSVKASKAKSTASSSSDGTKIVYKYLPLDIDAFYRQEAVSKPTTLYYSMFNSEDIQR